LSSKIKILQFLSTSLIGGTEKMVLSLIKGINKEIFDVDVCILSSKGEMGDMFEKAANVHYLNYEKLGIFKTLSSLFWLLKRNRYDIIHIYGLRANIIGRIVGKIAGCKNIVSGLRSKSLGEKEGKIRVFIEMLIDKLTLPFIKLYISNTQAAVSFLIKNGYPPSKFRVVHNGIEPNSLDLTPDKELQGRFKDVPILICVSNFRPLKGHRLLIEGLRIVKNHNFKFKLLLLGDGKLRDELVNLTSRLGLVDDIIFLGKKSSIGPYLSLADIFILPSIIEGMPVSIMEAYLARLPVIAFNVGGISELVLDKETGILVPPQDIEGLARAIEELLEDPEKRKRMGGAGYKRIKNEFSLEKMVRGIEDIYLELMNES